MQQILTGQWSSWMSGPQVTILHRRQERVACNGAGTPWHGEGTWHR